MKLIKLMLHDATASAVQLSIWIIPSPSDQLQAFPKDLGLTTEADAPAVCMEHGRHHQHCVTCSSSRHQQTAEWACATQSRMLFGTGDLWECVSAT